jgi:glycosyltransferase involved in cell wall biosynthesis
MKIAFVMPWHISERGGGAEVQANYLSQELAARGYEVSYICQTKINAKVNTSEVVNGFEICWLKSIGRFAWMDQNKYYDALVKTNPDVVLQRMSSNVTYSIGKYCKGNNKSFHWFCTDNEAPFSRFHVNNFTKRLQLKLLNSLKYTVFYLNALIMDYYRNKGMKNVTVAWSQNSFQKENVLQNFKLETHTMISGHPLPKSPIDFEEKFNFQTVLWCANLGTHKRPELFIELARQMKNSSLKFVMVGGHSSQEYVDQLFLNKPDNLLYMGECSFEKALSFFDSSSVFVNTSSAGGDGFPNTFIQAWLRGGVTFALGFDPDSVIEKNELGYNCSDLNQLEVKLLSVLHDKEKFITISNRIKNYAEQNHSIAIMSHNFLKHLSE